MNRIDSGTGSDYLQKIKAYEGYNWLTSPKKKCSTKYIRVLTGKASFEEYIELINSFSRIRRRRTVMTEGGIKKFFEKVGIDIGYFNGKQI